MNNFMPNSFRIRVHGRQRVALVVMLGLALTSGCSKTHEVDAAPANALVPAKYKYKLDFSSREVDTGIYRQRESWTMAVPKSWNSIPGVIEPVNALINGNSMILLSWDVCESGDCSWRDVNVPDDEHLLERRDEDYDRAGHREHRRVFVGMFQPIGPDNAVYVDVYWWVVGGVRFHHCEVQLDPALKEAAAAFEKACESAVVHDD